MKVYAFVKIRHHPQPDGQGAQYGDVVSVHRIETKRSEEELKFFLPVPIDIQIPCGDKYDREMKGRCGECRDNDPDLCDVQRICRAEWEEGTLFEAPKVVKKCRYKIDIDNELGLEILAVGTKPNKTEADRLAVIEWASKNIISSAVVIDKVDIK